MNCLIHCPVAPHDKHVHLVQNGVRRAVVHPSSLEQIGKSIPEDVLQVTQALFESIPPGAPIARDWPATVFLNPPRNSSIEMREILGSRCRGVGIEFGAGSSPFPIGLDAVVTYLDVHAKGSLENKLYPGQSREGLVSPAFYLPIERLKEWPAQSLDFIVACHVIEHTPDPIGAIVGAHRALRPGGILLLTVPDKHRTFDRKRELTTITHLFEDYVQPDASRDLMHYLDYGRNVLNCEGAELERYAASAQLNGDDIHFHVWDFASFSQMLAAIEEREAVHWSSSRGIPTLGEEGSSTDIEFYFFLQK